MKPRPDCINRSTTPWGGFTLLELLVTMVLVSVLGFALLGFGNLTMRLTSSNLATNHAHQEARLAAERLFSNLGDSASAFTLVQTDFTEPSITRSVDVDGLTGKLLSTQRTAGVRFWRPLVGAGPIPCRLISNANPNDTQLTFNAAGIEQIRVGDRLAMPLLGRTFLVLATAGVSASRQVTLDKRITTTFADSGANYTVGFFYRRAAFIVANSTLRYHANFFGATLNDFITIRRDVTSPAPFALLCRAAGLPTDSTQLRVSLETHDLRYSQRRISGSTTTYQSVIAPMTQPLRIPEN